MPHPKQTLCIVFFEKTITEKYWANELRNPVYISITSINGTELLS